VTIQLIVLGPALKAFHARTARPDLVRDIAELRKFGLALSACANTMRSQNIMLEDLLPGFAQRGTRRRGRTRRPAAARIRIYQAVSPREPQRTVVADIASLDPGLRWLSASCN
jgi:hypothetical protein